MQISRIFQSVLFLASVFLVFQGPSAFGKGDDKKYQMGIFDIFAAPKIVMGVGEYQVSGVDTGTMGNVLWGGKAGLKLGPILVGGEYLEGDYSAETSNPSGEGIDRFKYAVPNHEKVRTYGLVAGLSLGRLAIWFSSYPYVEMKRSTQVGDEKFNHTYTGSGSSVELNFRVWNLLYIGGYYQGHKLNEYTSDYVAAPIKDLPLDPNLKTSSWGISLGYLLPFSKIKEMKDLF